MCIINTIRFAQPYMYRTAELSHNKSQPLLGPGHAHAAAGPTWEWSAIGASGLDILKGRTVVSFYDEQNWCTIFSR